MKKEKLYLYPMRTNELLKTHNPYVYNLSTSLKDYFEVVNYGNAMRFGFLDVVRYFFVAKVFYFNWVENISSYKAILFSIFCVFVRICGKKIVWTHHNIHSHYQKKSIKNRLFVKFLSRFSNYVVLHTEESYNVLGLEPKNERVFYFFHPFFSKPIAKRVSNDIDTDILIWGNVRKSKGIHDFLKFVRDSQIEHFRIKIVGKFESEDYYEDLVNNYKGLHITIENRFIGKEELVKLHHRSACVLFPYTGSSVLNSGALITSLPLCVPIVGPDTGAFRELAAHGLLLTYKSFDDIFRFLEEDTFREIDFRAIETFCNTYTWSGFARSFYEKLTFEK